jgi:hypothetical protein
MLLILKHIHGTAAIEQYSCSPHCLGFLRKLLQRLRVGKNLLQLNRHAFLHFPRILTRVQELPVEYVHGDHKQVHDRERKEHESVSRLGKLYSCECRLRFQYWQVICKYYDNWKFINVCFQRVLVWQFLEMVEQRCSAKDCHR